MVGYASKPPGDGLDLYQLALQVLSEVLAVVELMGGPERSFLRDQLDRKSVTIPPLVKQGRLCESLVERRAVFMKAKRVAQDCMAVLTALGQGPSDAPALVSAQNTLQLLIEALGPLSVPPPLTR